MPEQNQISFRYKEVATALLKTQDIHDGLWGVYLKFNIKGGNVGTSEDDLVPTAMVGIVEIGLQRMDKESNISVNAAEVNPKPGRRPKGLRLAKK